MIDLDELERVARETMQGPIALSVAEYRLLLAELRTARELLREACAFVDDRACSRGDYNLASRIRAALAEAKP